MTYKRFLLSRKTYPSVQRFNGYGLVLSGSSLGWRIGAPGWIGRSAEVALRADPTIRPSRSDTRKPAINRRMSVRFELVLDQSFPESELEWTFTQLLPDRPEFRHQHM